MFPEVFRRVGGYSLFFQEGLLFFSANTLVEWGFFLARASMKVAPNLPGQNPFLLPRFLVGVFVFFFFFFWGFFFFYFSFVFFLFFFFFSFLGFFLVVGLSGARV